MYLHTYQLMWAIWKGLVPENLQSCTTENIPNLALILSSNRTYNNLTNWNKNNWNKCWQQLVFIMITPSTAEQIMIVLMSGLHCFLCKKCSLILPERFSDKAAAMLMRWVGINALVWAELFTALHFLHQN